MVHKKEKTIQLLKSLAGDFLARTSNRTSLITVTNVVLSEDGRRADILVSVMPKEKASAATDFMNRNVDEFREYVKSHSRMRILPRFAFRSDRGEEHRQRIDELLREEK